MLKLRFEAFLRVDNFVVNVLKKIEAPFHLDEKALQFPEVMARSPHCKINHSSHVWAKSKPCHATASRRSANRNWLSSFPIITHYEYRIARVNTQNEHCGRAG